VLWAALALTIGAAGGAGAAEINVPLPWMIGAMVAVTVGSLSGLPLFVHHWVRQPVVTILGVMLGSSFTPALLTQMADWWITVAGMAVYVAIVTALLTVYFRRIGGFDLVTAYFAGSPGGLNEMVIAGKDLGGDDRLIALVHAARLLFVIIAIPIGFSLFEGYRSGSPAFSGAALFDWSLREILILLGCAVLGAMLASWAGLPAAFILGPMLLSAAVHLAGWSESRPPAVLVALAQVVIGATVGARFASLRLRTVLRVLLLSLGAAVLMIALTLAFAILLQPFARSTFPGLVLAYAPGGLAEMSLVAFALAIDPAFVAAHHVLRIAMIVVAAPLLFGRFLRRRRAYSLKIGAE
jgi:membrane AbrB-like protein